MRWWNKHLKRKRKKEEYICYWEELLVWKKKKKTCIEWRTQLIIWRERGKTSKKKKHKNTRRGEEQKLQDEELTNTFSPVEACTKIQANKSMETQPKYFNTFASRIWPNFSKASFRLLSDVDHARPPTKQRYSTSSDILLDYFFPVRKTIRKMAKMV